MTSGRLEIAPGISVDEGDLQFEFVRASGPGGQNVNKVATAVQLRFDTRAASLPPDVHARLRKLAGKRINEEGLLVIQANRFRTQAQNRQDAVERLVKLVRKAAEKPKPRRKTRPSAEAKRRRLEAKRRRSALKRTRRNVDWE